MKQSLARYARQWITLGRNARLLLLSALINSFGNCAFSLFFNLYILRLGFQEDFVGLLTALPSLPAIFLALPAGFLAARLGPRRSLLLGSLALTLIVVAMCFSSSASALIACNLLFGVAMILTHIAFAPMMMKCSDSGNRDALFGTYNSFWYLGGVVGNLFIGTLPGFFAGWLHIAPGSAAAYRAALLTGCGLFSLAVVPLWLIREDRQTIRPAYVSPLQAWRKLPAWGRLILPEFLIASGAALFIPFFNVYYKQRFGVSDVMLGTIFAVFGLVTGSAALATPFVASRWGRMRGVVLLQLISLPFLLVLGLGRFLPLVLVCYWFRGALMSMRDPLYQAFMMEQVVEGERALINGLLNMSWNVGWVVMPYLSGQIQVRYGFSPIFLGAAVLYTLSVALTYLFFGRQRTQTETVVVTQAAAIETGEDYR